MPKLADLIKPDQLRQLKEAVASPPETSIREITPSLEPSILEAEAGGSGGHVVEVTIIRAGTSTNGNHYSEPLLRESAPLFDGARAFADHAGPHMTSAPRSVRDLVGHYRDPHFDVTPQGGRIRANFHLLPGQDWLWHIIQEAERTPSIYGLSIDAKGECKMAEIGGRSVRMVEAFRSINSVDVVSRPAAGGSLDRILAGEGTVCPNCQGTGTIDAGACTVCNGSGFLTEDAQPHDPAPLSDPDPVKDPEPTKDPEPVKEPETRNQKPETPNSTTQTKESHMSPAPVATPAQDTVADAVPAAANLTESHEPAASPAEDMITQLRAMQSERDASARELAQIKEALAPAPSTPPDPNASALQLLEQIKHDRDIEKSARFMESQLRESQLPQPIQSRLRHRYNGRVFTHEQLAEDIADEREVLGQLSTSGHVSGHGYEKPLTVGMSEYEQLQSAFDKMFDVCESEAAKSVPSLGGLRDAFRVATGVDITSIGGVDRPLQEAYASGLRNYVAARRSSGQLTEAESILREADVTTSTFSYLLGTSMNKRLLKDYQAWPSEWMKFTNVVGIKDFKQQDRIRLGAFGSLSTVAEDAAYTTLTLADTHATYTPTKRGNLVQVTRETIINDDLYAVKQIPQKLAVSAAFTLAEFIYGLLDPNGGNIYDGAKLFATSTHSNTGIADGSRGTANSGTALSLAALQTATIAMRKQQNAASKPIGLKPRFLLVPPDLEFTAMVILKSAGLPGGSNNDINPMMGFAEPIVAPQLNSFTVLGATTSFACVVADPRVIDTIEVGFIGGQVNPVLFIQDQPLYGLNFTQDVISYKVRHEYGGAVVDYRGFYLINN